MPIEKLRPTFTFTEDRLAELRTVVPEAFADGAVNWEALREALGAYLEDEGRDTEHFGLTWPGKRQARRLAAQPSKGTLIPAAGEGVDEATTRNLFIEGDNLEVLKLLQKSYAGRVKMIYIDPPYNTGNDFVYNDDYSEPLESYLRITGQIGESGEAQVTNIKSNGRFHSNWISMMYPRLVLARQLLDEDGIIFVSIDDNEAHNLRPLMDEVFGEENYLVTLFIQVRYEGKTLVEDADFHKMIEMVYVYGRTNLARLHKTSKEYTYDKFVWKIVEKGSPIQTLSLGGKRVDVFGADQYEIVQDTPSVDNLKEIWATGKILDGNSSGRFFRDHLTGRYMNDGYGALYKVYGIGSDKKNYRYFTGPKRPGATKGKYYQGVPANIADSSEATTKESPISNFYNFADSFGNCRHEGGIDFRSGKKPVEFIKTLLRLGTSIRGGDIVLDFFAGSCSTAHAVLDLNREEQGNRQFICVQLPEKLSLSEDGFDSIAELGKQRIRNVITKLRPQKQQLSLGLSHDDVGFRVYKLGRSNYKAWQDYQGESVEELETFFDRIETPLVDGWQREHVLAEAMLLQGFPLDSMVTDEQGFKRNRIQRVESDAVGHRLFVCLDDQIADETIAQIQLAAEDVFICLDSALTDEAKLRLGDRCNLRVI
jgi:adenine-specific DNA-methyltransferase